MYIFDPMYIYFWPHADLKVYKNNYNVCTRFLFFSVKDAWCTTPRKFYLCPWYKIYIYYTFQVSRTRNIWSMHFCKPQATQNRQAVRQSKECLDYIWSGMLTRSDMDINAYLSLSHMQMRSLSINPPPPGVCFQSPRPGLVNYTYRLTFDFKSKQIWALN